MVDLDASFFHHLLELAVADRVRNIPAHAPEDDLPLKMTAFEIDHRGALRSCPTTIMPRQALRHSFATESVDLPALGLKSLGHADACGAYDLLLTGLIVM